MKCPKCGHHESKSVRSPADFIAKVHREMGEIRRERECMSCMHRWATVEMPLGELQRIRALAYMTNLQEIREG